MMAAARWPLRSDPANSHTERGTRQCQNLQPDRPPPRASGIEPYTYMMEVLTKLPSSTTEKDIDKLLPWNQGETIPV